MKRILDQKTCDVIRNHTNFFINCEEKGELDCAMLGIASDLLELQKSKVYVLTCNEGCIKKFSEEMCNEKLAWTFRLDPRKDESELEYVGKQILSITKQIDRAADGMNIFTIEEKTETGINVAIRNLLQEMIQDFDTILNPILVITTDVIELINHNPNTKTHILSSFYSMRKCLFDTETANQNRLTVITGGEPAAVPYPIDTFSEYRMIDFRFSGEKKVYTMIEYSADKTAILLDYNAFIYNAENAAIIDNDSSYPIKWFKNID